MLHILVRIGDVGILIALGGGLWLAAGLQFRELALLRIVLVVTGGLALLVGIASFALYLRDQPNWHTETVTYCGAHGGASVAVAGLFGRTKAVICTDGSVEPYVGEDRWVRRGPS